MPNAVVNLYRKYLADTGQTDETPDYEITSQLGEWATRNNPGLFDEYPDFGQEFGQIREANAPSLAVETGRALKSGMQGLASTALGGAALLTDSDYLAQKAKSFEEDAAQNAPTIPSMEDIAPGRRGVGSLFSKDTARYAAAKIGGAIPSLAEGVGLAAVGGAIGSAAGPEGTVAGAAEGAVESFLGKGIVKSAIRRLIEARGKELIAANLITDASEAAVADSIRAGSKDLMALVAKEATSISARRGWAAANALNMAGLNIGAMANETPDKTTAVIGGLVGAIPAMVVSEIVGLKLYPGVAKAVGQKLGTEYVTRLATEAVKDAGVLGSAMALQETANAISRNIAEGREATDLNSEDWKRIREAGVGGALTGPLLSPLTARGTREAFAQRPRIEPPAPEAPPAVPTPVPPAPAVPPTELGTMAQASEQARNEQAMQALADQQTEIQRQLAAQAGRGTRQAEAARTIEEQTRQAGLAMVGETPDVIARRQAEQAGLAMAGAQPVDLSNPEQAARLDAERLGREMMGNVPEAEKNFLPAPAIQPTAEELKLQQVRDAVRVPGITYQYSVFGRDMVPTGERTQIDVIGPDGKNLTSTNLDQLSSLGVNLPRVPESFPIGKYTVEQIRAETPSAKPILPAAQPAEAAPPAQDIPAANAGVGGIAPGVAGAEKILPAKPEVQTLYRFNGKKTRQSIDRPVPANMVTADQWAELQSLRGKKGEITQAFKSGFARTLKENVRLAAAVAKNEGSREMQSAAKGRTLKFGPRPDGATDIVDAIQELGGVPRPPRENRDGTFDSFEDTFRGSKRLLVSKSEGGFDTFTQDLASHFPQFAHIEGMTASQVGALIDTALSERANLKRRMGQESLMGAQAQRFNEAVIEGTGRKSSKVGKPVSVDDLSVGTKLKAQGQELEVESVSPDDGSVKLKDGPRFGDQTVPAGTVIRPDKGSLRRPKGGDYFAGSGVPETPIVPDAKVPKAQAPPAPVAFEAGKVIQGAPSLDFRNTAMAAEVTNDQWVEAVKANLAHPDARLGSHDSSKSDTRIAVAFRSPDGRVILTGVTLPARTLDVEGRTIIKEPTLQRMGVDESGKRSVQVSGGQPALLRDAVNAGYKPFAILHFDIEPGKIHQVFGDEQAFDRAYFATEKSSGKNLQPEEVPSKMFRNAKAQEQLIEQIDVLLGKWSRAHGAERERIGNLMGDIYKKYDNLVKINQQLSGDSKLPEDRDNPDPEYRRSPAGDAIGSSRNSTFQRAIANLQQIGGDVQLLSREMLAQQSAEVANKRIADLQQQITQSTDPVAQQFLKRRLSVLQERAKAAQDAAGVTYSPWHIALAMDDVANASTNNLVTLLHEAAESLTMRLTVEQRGAVRTAIDDALSGLRARAQAAAERTGVPLAKETGPHDLLAETLAQEFTAKGIPDSSSLAQAIVRWIKDVYYRTAMALQAAFNGEPDPEAALAWYENQLAREVGGDYSYSFGNLLDKFIPSPLQERVRKFDGRTATPGGIADFLDPVSGIVRQPQVEALSRDALNWDLAYQTHENLGKELEIPDPEARARIKGSVMNGLADFYETLRQSVAKDMDWNEFFGHIKRVGEEDPKLLIAELNQKFAGAGDAKIGGERMTEPMNREAQTELWSRFRKLGLSMRRQSAQAGRSIAEATKQITENADTINKLEGDVRNAALHEDRLKVRAKDLVKELAQSISRGRDASHVQGALAEAIRQEENLRDSDAIPGAYRDVLKRVYDGETPIFDYIRAIAELDLPLAEMTNREVLNAIKGGAEFSPPLANLTSNKPLAVVLATLARRNADQVDQIQLGWLRDTSKFREIHSQLEEIRTATASQLREMSKQFSEQHKATGLLARLKGSYFAKRDRQNRASERVARNEAKQALMNKAVGLTDQRADEAAASAGGAQFEWYPEEGSVWTAMVPKEDGSWQRANRVLHFNPDGSAVDGDQLRRDIYTNLQWLRERADDTGKPKYNQIKAQTEALKLLDVVGQQQRTWSWAILNAIDHFVQTPIAATRSLGGPSVQRIITMLHKYQFNLRNYLRQLESPAFQWQKQMIKTREASGLKDNGDFLRQVYNPMMYFLSVNPGLEETAGIREVTRYILGSLPAPKENFKEQFGTFVRQTMAADKLVEASAREAGAFVEDKKLGPELRVAIPKGIITGMRSLNGGLVDTITKDMQKAGWKLSFDQEVKSGKVVKSRIHPSTFEAIDPAKAPNNEAATQRLANLSNTEAMNSLLARLFTPGVIGQWLEPFIRKPGQEPFSYQNEPIPQTLVQEAWSESGGNVLNWIDRLGQKLGVEPSKEGDDPVALFRMSMLRNLDQLFGHEARLAYDASQVPGLLDPHGPKPHALMDARVSDLLPPEHVDFSTYEPESMHRLMARISYHGAFGRNAAHIKSAFGEMMNHLQGKASQFDTLVSLHKSKGLQVAEAAARGWNYDELKAASKRYKEAQSFQESIGAALGVSANQGPLGDFHKAMAILNFMVGQIVDNPKTAAYNLLSPATRPLAQRSLGPLVISNTVRAYANTLRTGLGSLLEAFNIHLFKAAEYDSLIGNAEGRAFSNLPWGVVLSDLGHAGDNQQGLNRWLVKPSRIMRQLQRKGAPTGFGEAHDFPRLSVIPGLGVINSISNMEVQGSGGSLAREFERLVKKGANFFAQNPEAANDPTFRFKASDLTKRFDHAVFDWWRQKAGEYGLGNLEDIVRDATRRQAEDPAQRLLTNDQALTVSMMNQNEFSGNSSINTTPTWLMTNPFLRMTMPLLRWPLWMMSAVHESAKPRAGENVVKPFLRTMGTLALWNLPIGLAFSFLMDEYDKKLVGRKSNLPELPGTAAFPFLGVPLTLLQSKKPLTDIETMLVRSARAGNIYGLGGDVAAQMFVGLDPTTGQRSVSLDQRVLVASQIGNIMSAVNAWARGGEATWGNVARPLLMAMGGNGVLHSIDLTNHLLDLDNAQSRLMQRAAASNWIRSAAQEVDMDIKRGDAFASPTPLSTQTREMYLAALANDRAGFLESYRKALNAARERVTDDPSIAGADREREAKNRVLASWHSRNPTGVLATKPTTAQFNQLLSVMDPAGQEIVREAIQRFNTFSTMIEPTPVERYFQRQFSGQQSAMNPNSLMRRMQGGSLLFSTK